MTMPPDATPPTPSAATTAMPPSQPTREYRATVTFVVSVVFIVVVLVIFSGQAGIVPTLLLLGPVLALAIDATEAYGLSHQRPWARYAMTPMLWIVMVSGFVSSFMALGRGSLEIPIGSILAIWALIARPSAAFGPIPASSTEGALLIVVAFVAALAPFIPF